MGWRDGLRGDPVGWLAAAESPGVRYLALRDFYAEIMDDPSRARHVVPLQDARREAHREGPIRVILDAMEPGGYWSEPGPGYRPKYWSTVWALIMLAQLGADPSEDARIQQACGYLLDHGLTERGQFNISGTPSTTVDCLQGNMCWALTELGCEDPRLALAYEWMARSVTGEGVAPVTEKKAPLRYYAGKCGPDFVCGANNKLPCAWGAVKVMGAFGVLPEADRTPLIQAAIQRGIDFLLGTDPAEAGYPTGYAKKPSGNWWKFGFPVFYVTDLLQNAAVLVRLGYGQDLRLANALDFIRGLQDDQGRWSLEYSYIGKTWVDFGPKKQPNPWVTLRVLRVLKMAGTDTESA